MRHHKKLSKDDADAKSLKWLRDPDHYWFIKVKSPQDSGHAVFGGVLDAMDCQALPYARNSLGQWPTGEHQDPVRWWQHQTQKKDAVGGSSLVRATDISSTLTFMPALVADEGSSS